MKLEAIQIRLLEDLKRIKEEARPLVEKRFSEFKNLGENGTDADLFSELCFCVLTANWSAQGGIKAQQVIGPEGFLNLTEAELEQLLTKLGHRYPKARASYIVKNRPLAEKLREVIRWEPFAARYWLVQNAWGIGYKEASHFLRNVGVDCLAILDRHVLKTMLEYGLVNSLPKSLTRKNYLFLEGILKDVADQFGEPLGKFDLYLWYLLKGKVEK
ncbi:N-glycosylase/DNA lyase [Pseudothermotoga thermarum]|uniref:8-oxoguanine DNA glycosylase/AP lyase n=1 Tax=Pseudothermotoga thermarum DSM 5069 TaxID=688269 RepID=F7YXQ1_9THEM|nr:N-glycosylase/DNA lyase [Pseudothermotoga thermarum]AEH50695.1 DNA-(apurinic or apyrimidinic site) lyase [Pseudothermotoga thermarum DSM 5069]